MACNFYINRFFASKSYLVLICMQMLLCLLLLLCVIACVSYYHIRLLPFS